MKKKMTAGFTLVELIVVIAILGILAGVGTVGYSGYIKKANQAADNQLVAALNYAYAAACLENGVDATTTTAADITVGSDKKVGEADIAVSNPAAKADAIKATFGKYFAGNENAEFKVATSLTFANGMFKANFDQSEGGKTITHNGVTYTVTSEQLAAIESSTYGQNMTMDQLMGDVTGMVNALNSALNGGEKIAGILGNPADWGVTADPITEKDEYLAQLSNAAVLYVAKNMTEGTTETIVNEIKAGSIGNLMTLDDESTMLVNMAGLYGIATGFAHSDAATGWSYEYEGVTYDAAEYYDFVNAEIAAVAGAEMDSTDKMLAIADTMGLLAAYIYKDGIPSTELTTEFANYESSQLGKDTDGLLNAMTALDTNSGSLIESGAITDGFGSSDISEILNQLFG